jgi:hypothetical protein
MLPKLILRTPYGANSESTVTRESRQDVATKTCPARAVLATSVLPHCIIFNSKVVFNRSVEKLVEKDCSVKGKFRFLKGF